MEKSKGFMALVEAVGSDEVEIIGNLNDMARRCDALILSFNKSDKVWACLWEYQGKDYSGLGESIGIAVTRALYKAPAAGEEEKG